MTKILIRHYGGPLTGTVAETDDPPDMVKYYVPPTKVAPAVITGSAHGGPPVILARAEYVAFRWANNGDPFWDYVKHPGPVIFEAKCYGGPLDGDFIPVAYPPPDQLAEEGYFRARAMMPDGAEEWVYIYIVQPLPMGPVVETFRISPDNEDSTDG
jgi:hypothetical protein